MKPHVDMPLLFVKGIQTVYLLLIQAIYKMGRILLLPLPLGNDCVIQHTCT